MLSWIRTTIQRNRARAFVIYAPAWYFTCLDASKVMGDALHNQSIIKQDIGSVIDQVDRMLLQLGFNIPDSLGTLRMRNPDLAKRFDAVTKQIYQLRNETTIFLIRSQGSGPMSGEEPDEDVRMVYYYQAFNNTFAKIMSDSSKCLSSIDLTIWHSDN